MMRPQDIVILLKLISCHDKPWQYRDLSAQLYIPISEISNSLKRSAKAGLYHADSRSVHRLALMEFIQFGLKYVFPTSPGTMVSGIATAHSHPFYKNLIKAEMQYVWPYDGGNVRGLMIEPLHPNVPEAVMQDELLYTLLASVDILRVGRVREANMALAELRKALL